MIEYDSPRKLESKAIYSKYWKTLQIGYILLRVGLPGIIENTTVTVIKEPSPPKERIYETRVAFLKMVPSVIFALEAFSKLQHGDSWGIHIAGIGNFSPSAIKLLPETARTVIFVEKVKKMLDWIARESDTVFADWFCYILQTTPEVMLKTFQASIGVPLSISSILDLKNNTFLNDEIIRSVMELFIELYGTNNRYLFISPIQIQL